MSDAKLPPEMEERIAAMRTGMTIALHARQAPDRMAMISDAGDRTFGEMNANANRLVRALRKRGIKNEDGLALLCSNRPEFLETHTACMRGGLRMTPVNWHLDSEAVSYVTDDCEAKVLVADARFSDTAVQAAKVASAVSVKIAVGGDIPGFENWDDVIGAEDGSDIDDPVRGSQMLYTSGTTGRPKGVYRKPAEEGRQAAMQARAAASQAGGAGGGFGGAAAYDPETSVSLLTGPLYHAAPLSINALGPLNQGVGLVLMDRWDPEETLRLIEKHRITHTHMVATMFHRLLKLPDEVRNKYDVSSMTYIIHGAAPCPPHVKKAMIDWFGMVVYEYFAATEGGGGYFLTPEEALAKPGSVGKSPDPESSRILNEDGDELPAGETGLIYFKAPDTGRFEYFKASEKTRDAYRGDYFTLGDMGYMDEDGYLFLTGRSAETIISGGVNVYPQATDDVLLQHPAVMDVCTIGVPNEEWGEEVKSVVQLHPGMAGSDELAEELIEFAKVRLAGFQCPRSVDFAEDLPRLPAGKIVRHKVRAPYWEGREKSI